MKPYPQYKDSGVPWLGEIPAHWNSLKLKNLLTPVSERSRPDLPLLSVLRAKGVIKRDTGSKEENHNFIPDDLSNYKVVQKSQLAMNKMKAWQGSYGISPHDGIVSPAYFVFAVNAVNGDFFHTALRSQAYIPFFTQASDGVRVGQWDLNRSRMKEIPFFAPSEEEQIQIPRYLNWKTAQINKFIRNKRRLIALLKEQKQNIINQAVTRGINPDVKLKPSGVEWIGDIPEHWEVKPLKRAFSQIFYGTSISSSDEGSYLVLGMGNIKEGEVSFSGCGRLKTIPAELVLRPNDLLFNRTNSLELVGKVGIFLGHESEQVTFASYLVCLRCKADMCPTYLNYLLNCSTFLRFARLHAIPSLHQANLNPTRYGRLSIPLPPYAEQKHLIDKIAAQTLSIDTAISRAENEIQLILEYRDRLIADVVTGKVDVRGIPVPEVSEEELLPPMEDTEEPDEMPDDEQGEHHEDD